MVAATTMDLGKRGVMGVSWWLDALVGKEFSKVGKGCQGRGKSEVKARAIADCRLQIADCGLQK